MKNALGNPTRRELVKLLASSPVLAALGSDCAGARTRSGFRSLFDGRSLRGWHTVPRVGADWDLNSPWVQTAKRTFGRWLVEHGAIVASQEIRYHGGFLVTDEEFGDFELLADVKPDWPCDTGILLRTPAGAWPGFQVLIDHRPGGSIGGYYGNELAGFHAVPYAIDVRRNAAGIPIGLMEADPKTALEPVTEAKQSLFTFRAPVQTFLETWKFGDWNSFRIRCVGHLPVISTWINGVRISEIDTGKIVWPGFDPVAVSASMRARGHIALELHDNNLQFDPLKEDRWGADRAVRWRNIAIRELLRR